MRNDCFRDPQQRFEACRALLATGELAHLWTEKGPTDEASCARAGNPSRMPGGTAPFCSRRSPSGRGRPFSSAFDELITLEEAEPICKLITATIYGHKAIDVVAYPIR